VLGPWDLFIEHGHRLFAAMVGLLCIAFVITVWRCESRRWIRATALAAIAAVLAFGLHRSLIEVVVAMAALGVVVQLTLGS